ncbi:MAG: hypothetical protein AMS25_03870 [Gemmatimonas sp. SM23_52]|nr:MAG: hypothetical protein AMS25_03870 [Gemmatimonas sp. SM23_52]
MAPLRLNLAALRDSLLEPEALPDILRLRRGLAAAFFERPVSRRTAIQVTGSAVAGFMPVLNRLHVFLFVLGNSERWVIDAHRYAGSPYLRHTKSDDGLVRVELRGARFPGTRLPADFVCEVVPGLIGSRMRLRLALGGFRCEVPFEEWLLGRARAHSRIRLNRRVFRVAGGPSLVLSGRAEAELAPDGVLRLSGRGLASLSGLGTEVHSDSVTLSLADPDAPSALDDPPTRRTVINLERGTRAWGLRPKLPIKGPGILRYADEPFDSIAIEAGENRRPNVRRAAVAYSADGRVAGSWEPGGRLLDDSGSPARIPLVSARYAVGFDRAGEQRALLARFREPLWLHGEGFSIEIGDAPGLSPFEMVATNGTLERMRCEPALLRTVLPVAGAIVEPSELPAGSRIALTDSQVGDGQPPPAARLSFNGRGSAAGLVMAAAPPLALLRPRDLFSITFDFVNLGLQIEGPGAATLVRETTEEAPGSFIIARFPPQNIAEEAFFEPGEEPGTGDIPVRAFIAGWSRLAFRLPSEVSSLPYTLDALLDWTQLEPSLVATAQPPPPPLLRLIGQPMIIDPREGIGIIRATIAGGAVARLKAEARVDPELRQSVAQELGRNLPRGVRLAPEQLQKLASTVTQTRPGYAAIEGPILAEIVTGLLRRPYEPASYQTALETPWRLILSPNRFSAWAHSFREVTDEDTHITELWHTRLGVHRTGAIPPGESPVDEVEDYYRTVRAVWSPDYTRDASAKEPPHYPDSHPGNPFRMSLDARDRHELVTLTSDFLLPECEDRIVRADRFMLTALGAWMNVRGAWELGVLPADAQELLSLEEWRHRATMARDQFVKVVYRGYLFPFGHRASLIKITERKWKSWRTYQTAFLRQRMYVVVRQPEKVFPALFQPHQGRKFPFTRVTLVTRATPNLDDPTTSEIDGMGQEAFWLRVGGSDFLFHCVAEDLEGRQVEFTAPLAFIDGKHVTDTTVLNAAAAEASYTTLRKTCSLDGQRVAYAESRKSGDTTFETASLKFGAEVVSEYDDASFRAADQPRFYPGLEGAAVELPAVKHIAGAAGAVPIKYPDRYLERGFEGDAGDSSGNSGQIFAELAEAVELIFGGGSAGTDKVGGLATPNLNISGLSRLTGLVSGDLDEMMQGVFDPTKFFEFLDVELFGGISLLDIVRALTSGFGVELGSLKDEMENLLSDLTEQVTTALLESLPKTRVPAFLTQIINEAAEVAEELESASQLPKQIQLIFKWDPEVQSFGPFIVNGDPADTLSLTAIGLIPISLDGTAKEPSYTVSAKVQDFTLDLFNIIAIEVNSVRFNKEAGEKADVKADVEDVTFAGPLAFVEQLQNVIPSDGFVDADIDVLPTGIKAGFTLALPTIGVGVFTLDNMSLGGRLSVPFTGDPVRFRFNFCTREQPFTLTVYALGGGGFFSIELGLDGVELLEAALEFGASIAVDFGVASGGVSIKAGVYFKMESDVATLTGYFRLNGHVDVLGLITASILFYLALTYQSSPKMVWGEATLTIEIEILFFSMSVDIKCRKEFTTPPPPHFADLMTADEWVTYQLAYAN